VLMLLMLLLMLELLLVLPLVQLNTSEFRWKTFVVFPGREPSNVVMLAQ